jgi:dTDP-glucose pyrophosphorylase
MISKNIIHAGEPVKKAMELIGTVKAGGLIVVDNENRLLGTITDGDIRRWILSGGKLDQDVTCCMFSLPTYSPSKKLSQEFLDNCHKKRIRFVPFVDKNLIVKDIIFLEEGSFRIEKETTVVIMAGGLGQRLGNLTKDCPKPMLLISNKPILEWIIESLVRHGLKKIYISVNYLAEQITDYFQDGSRFGCEIIYIHEKKKLGTAGALSLVKEDINGNVLVMNGDLLTSVNYSSLIDYHASHEHEVTLCVRKFDFQVPYGVVEVKNSKAHQIVEKPVHEFFVSAGVYVVDSSILSRIPEEEFYDMPTLINDSIRDGAEVSCYPVHEEWIDIGKVNDLIEAREKYDK